jgi:hypothetical protein
LAVQKYGLVQGKKYMRKKRFHTVDGRNPVVGKWFIMVYPIKIPTINRVKI